ncbi:MAG: hypothetical protein AABY15_01345 [Nanoarchaeota archaeon]
MNINELLKKLNEHPLYKRALEMAPEENKKEIELRVKAYIENFYDNILFPISKKTSDKNKKQKES